MKGESLGEVELIELHKQLQASLLQTENKVFELETLFLEEASTNNGLVKSWENGNSRTTVKAHVAKKRPVLADRIFSLSSMTSGVYKLMDEEQCTEGTDQYKAYLQKRKPPRVVKALSGTGRAKKDERASANKEEDFNDSRGNVQHLAKVGRISKPKRLLMSSSKKLKRK